MRELRKKTKDGKSVWNGLEIHWDLTFQSHSPLQSFQFLLKECLQVQFFKKYLALTFVLLKGISGEWHEQCIYISKKGATLEKKHITCKDMPDIASKVRWMFLTCIEHSMTDTAMMASSMVTISLYMSLECAVTQSVHFKIHG